MKLHALLLSHCLLLTSSLSLWSAPMHNHSRQTATVPQGPKIRVLLEKDVASAFIEARGQYRVIRRDSGAFLSSGKMGKRFVAHALQDGLRWGEEYPDVYQIAIVPLAKDSSIFVNGIQYKGAISIYHVKDNRITIVNEIAIEEYLKSSLAVDFSEGLSKEAMAALAIAARTEAYAKALKGATSSKPWDIKATDANYFGFGVTQRKNGVDEAVEWTRFMVLESSKGPVQNIQLKQETADELAQKGFDAKKILQSACPHAKLGTTIDPKEFAIR